MVFITSAIWEAASRFYSSEFDSLRTRACSGQSMRIEANSLITENRVLWPQSSTTILNDRRKYSR